jgi:hypothetical protein
MPELETNRRPIASRSAEWAKASAAFLARTSVTPNQISAVSVLFAAVGAALVAFKHDAIGLIGCAAAVQARLVCNLLDGMVAIEGAIVGRVAIQRVSRPYRRFSVHRRLGLCCRLAGARLVRRAGRGVNRLCPRVRRLALLRAGFSRADGQAAAHGRPDSSLRRRRRRVVVYRHPVCPDCGRGHHRRRLGRDVRNPHARHRRQAQGKLSCGCPIS